MGRFKFRGEPVSMLAIIVNLFVGIGGFIFGYDIGYISGCLIMLHFQIAFGTLDSASSSGFSLSSHRQSVIVSLLSAGCFAGALLGVPTADFLGRRGAIFMMSSIFIVGVIVQISPTGNLGALIAGRFVAGLGVGALSALVPLYQGEISPKALRGAFVSCYQVMITFGILIAYILDLACKGIDGAGVPFLPRSPRESILNGDTEVARVVIARMHAIPVQDPLVQAYIDEITEKIEEEKHSGTTYLDCFDFRNELKTGQRTLIGCLVQSFQQLTGQIIFGLLDMIGTLPGLYCLDRFGRRRTMIAGALVMGLSYMLYAVIGSYALYPNNDPTQVARKGAGGGMLFVICVFVLSYGCSWGPGGWVNTGEIAPLRTRAKQLSFVSASNWVWNFLLSYFSPPISAKIGAKYGFVFFGANFLAAAFIYLFVPEMAGLSLEEINGLFQAGIPARKSFEYNKQVRQQDRKNQDIISAGGEAKLGGQNTKEGEMRRSQLLHGQSKGARDLALDQSLHAPMTRTITHCPSSPAHPRAYPEPHGDKSKGKSTVARTNAGELTSFLRDLSDERDHQEVSWMGQAAAAAASSSAKPKPTPHPDVAPREAHFDLYFPGEEASISEPALQCPSQPTRTATYGSSRFLSIGELHTPPFVPRPSTNDSDQTKPSTQALSPDLLVPQAASKRLLSLDRWDTDGDDEPESLMPPSALIEQFQKIGAWTALAAVKEAAESKQKEEEEELPIKPLPARGRPLRLSSLLEKASERRLETSDSSVPKLSLIIAGHSSGLTDNHLQAVTRGAYFFSSQCLTRKRLLGLAVGSSSLMHQTTCAFKCGRSSESELNLPTICSSLQLRLAMPLWLDEIHTSSAQLYVGNALSLAYSVVIYYDYMITVIDEVELFWPPHRRVTWPSLIFFSIRYFALLGQIPLVIGLFIRPYHDRAIAQMFSAPRVPPNILGTHPDHGVRQLNTMVHHPRLRLLRIHPHAAQSAHDGNPQLNRHSSGPGALYFIALFLSTLSNIAMYLYAPPILQGTNTILTNMLSVVTVSRLMLDLREANHKIADSGDLYVQVDVEEVLL
ncbi:hypothetical protein EW146_g7113 [Bondarzewia mesenterica]|uniref:Major facilitator superfamily (MFS) profile domain-containing protein n=1 Tax=Bondarzewia mesenterica TaxID=1095465 RepID=A0A4S4LMB0_9AGAM|nr:hypothetical protein EW146_g7113 [Bondarzewia mesenterica]